MCPSWVLSPTGSHVSMSSIEILGTGAAPSDKVLHNVTTFRGQKNDRNRKCEDIRIKNGNILFMCCTFRMIQRNTEDVIANKQICKFLASRPSIKRWLPPIIHPVWWSIWGLCSLQTVKSLCLTIWQQRDSNGIKHLIFRFKLLF